MPRGWVASDSSKGSAALTCAAKREQDLQVSMLLFESNQSIEAALCTINLNLSIRIFVM